MATEDNPPAAWQLVYSREDRAEFETILLPQLQALQQQGQISGWSEQVFEDFNAASVVFNQPLVCWLADGQQKQLLQFELVDKWQLAFLPHADNPRTQRRFWIDSKLPQACQQILGAPLQATDLVFCNQQLVLGSVIVGDPKIMRSAAKVQLSIWGRIQQFASMSRQLIHSHLMPYKLATFKQTQINTAAAGITVVYRSEDSDFTRRVLQPTSEDESNLNAVILAPRSIMDAVNFVYHRFFSRRFENGQPKDYLGKIKSESLRIFNSREIDFSIDGEIQQADELLITLKPRAIQLLNSAHPKNHHQGDLKESVRVDGLPKGESIKSLVMRPLPWIDHADPEEIKDTFLTLKENSILSQPYLVLMVLSTLLATVGLFANSAPVIIGAMILAPLMAPIISLAMGLLRQTPELILNASKTLVTGISLALLFGTLFTVLMPLQSLNSEISARLSPTILDLGVAIISGIAGAYANAKSEVAKSLAGVAIAVALVPPLAVSGMGIGWWDWHVFSGAFLLFVTNLVGIVLAAAATFLIMGFSPFRLAQKGLFLSTVFVAVVSIPLVVAFNSMVQEQKMLNVLEKWQCVELDTPVKLRDVQLHGANPLKVSATLLANRPLKSADLDLIKLRLEQQLGEKIELEAVIAIKR